MVLQAEPSLEGECVHPALHESGHLGLDCRRHVAPESSRLSQRRI